MPAMFNNLLTSVFGGGWRSGAKRPLRILRAHFKLSTSCVRKETHKCRYFLWQKYFTSPLSLLLPILNKLSKQQKKSVIFLFLCYFFHFWYWQFSSPSMKNNIFMLIFFTLHIECDCIKGTFNYINVISDNVWHVSDLTWCSVFMGRL